MKNTQRRELVVAAIGLLLAPLSGFAQQAARVRRVGFLATAGPATSTRLLAEFRDGMRELGWMEGQNLAIEYRWPKISFEREPDVVASLLGRKVEVIVAWPTPAALAAKHATSTIPIVFVASSDPIGNGLIKSFQRPEANVTGVSNLGLEIAAKQVQLLLEVLPGIKRIGLIRNPANPANISQFNEVARAIRKLGLQPQVLDARSEEEFETAFAQFAADGAQGVVLVPDPSTLENREKIASLALKARLPTMFQRHENVEAGGFMSYGADLPSQFRQAARFVDRILKGAKPSALPVEQPTRIDLVVNERVAKALGITIPQTVRLQADRIIE